MLLTEKTQGDDADLSAEQQSNVFSFKDLVELQRCSHLTHGGASPSLNQRSELFPKPKMFCRMSFVQSDWLMGCHLFRSLSPKHHIEFKHAMCALSRTLKSVIQVATQRWTISGVDLESEQ